MIITLKQYLERLEALESQRNEQRRRPVPTMRELAEAVNVHEVTLSDIANNRKKFLNLATASAIIGEMRSRGFSMQASDLIEYAPVSDNGETP